ncbi:uncharacterized protein [Antedon mediterranea]|uniref:uncharacterized protein n=1 Tax=Antedon mediterranea TaxID=105859 RepID=UPI003AF6D8E3
MADHRINENWTNLSQIILISIMVLTTLIDHTTGERFNQVQKNEFPGSQQSYPFKNIYDIPVHLRERPGEEDFYKALTSPEFKYILKERVLFTQTRPLPRLRETHKLKEDKVKTTKEVVKKWSPYEGIFKRQSAAAGVVPVEACPSNSRWVHITEGRTLNNTMVELLNVQWFWQTDCVNSGTACQGFSGRSSSCLPKHSWVPAYARESGTTNDYSWFYISVASCCACAVKL